MHNDPSLLERAAPSPLLRPDEPLRITRLETFPVRPNWLFLKIHTDAGIAGWGEPVLEGRASTCAEAVRALEPYLLGKDPRHVVHHWHAIYRNAFYRGGEILTSALSGVDMALWDIRGKALGAPVHALLGGPTRTRVRVYSHCPSLTHMQDALARGFRAFKTKPALRRTQRAIATPAQVQFAVEQFRRTRQFLGDEIDLAIDFHGAVDPATSKLLIRGLEPYQPMFVEEPCLHQNVDVLADIARSTCLPIAAGERVFTKWGFRELLEKRAVSVLQPDIAHAGGITEVRLIAGMAEAYYVNLAPHNPLGPIALAAAVQLAASIPNFLIQEQVTLGEGWLVSPFTVREGCVDVPAAPGLGVEPDEEFIRAHAGEDIRSAEAFDDEDGSVGELHGYAPPLFSD